MLTILFSVMVSWFFVSRDMGREIDDITTENLARSTHVFMKALELYDGAGGRKFASHDELESWAGLLGIRITIIGADGTVIGDSEVAEDRISDLDNHSDRPEVRAALDSGSGIDRRYSETTKDLYLYYAAKAEDGDYIVRGSFQVSRFYMLLSRVRTSIFLSLFLAGLVALGGGIIGVRRITSPLRLLTEASRAARSGERAIYPIGGPSEIEELSRALRDSEQARAEMVDSLRNERNQLETIVQNAPCGLMLLDRDGKIICVNGVFAPLLRERPNDLAGLGAAGELRSPELAGMIASAREDGAGGMRDLEFAFRRRGAEFFYKARAVPAGTGETLVVLDDETQRHMMETARKTFIADAGHEFQTPLASISAAAELLAEMDNSTATERAPYLEEIKRQRERMTKLADDLLLLSRLESGTPLEPSETFDLTELCEELVSDAMKSPMARDIEWDVELASSQKIYFSGRRSEIMRSISNLLDNAAKYTRKRHGAEGGRISVSLAKSDGHCLISVRDNGTGISADKVSRIFGRFERADNDRSRGGERTGGYGLGLAIAKTAVESHGGSIEAKVTPDGTEFIVTLPLAGD
jgi:two-component system phosphate regulon sensor histidine kinase PhoR